MTEYSMTFQLLSAKNKPIVLVAGSEIEKSVWMSEINKAKSEWNMKNGMLGTSGTFVRNICENIERC